MTADLPGGFDDLGDAAVGRPEHPAVQFGPGLVAGRLGVLLQCLFDRFGSVFPQCGLMVFPGVVIVSR